ncbi:hypothetical protein MUK42_32212 [Musa troglodytarum]|uniref:Uncharacterized protein n=1 Tax=Musa troglodytarum TaxID=320322 RepID=A0A9E7JY81_9LILI|nr:hypothetical protein MUK42_32212 [Musa troglodytarum]
MVLWEMTVITAYFLGLKRTYRLALRIQRRLVGPNHPRTRQFLYRRTRSVFDVAVKVHKNIQQRDKEVGRNLGNWILRWLHRMKPSAEICPPVLEEPTSTSNISKHAASSSQPLGAKEANNKAPKKSDGQVLFTPLNSRSTSFPSMSMMLQPRNSMDWNCQQRRISRSTPYGISFQQRRGLAGVFRDDISQWMLH